eukprot:5652676-Pyramimonas_sp.AAC.1
MSCALKNSGSMTSVLPRHKFGLGATGGRPSSLLADAYLLDYPVRAQASLCVLTFLPPSSRDPMAKSLMKSHRLGQWSYTLMLDLLEGYCWD